MLESVQPMASRPRTIDVLSDSTGHTAERVLRAALLQFPQADVRVRVHARVRTPKAARPIIERAASEGSLLLFSVVSPELSKFIHKSTFELHVEAIDVIGSVIGRLQSFLNESPLNRPGSLLPLSEEYFRRIEAVDFTVKNDGGRDPRSFPLADLVLVGVSRTSKTPLSTLLAQRGLKVANFTLVLDVQPPAELEACTQDRIVGLTIDVESLCSMRQARLRKLGMPAETQYGVRAHVQEEIDFAESLFKKHPDWPVVDMTARSVEETAGIILQILERRVVGGATHVSSV